MASIRFSDHRLPMSKKRLKPLCLRDFLLDDLSSCSSNGFKSFPRRQSSSTVRRLLDAEIKRSGMFRHNRRLSCGLVFSHAVQKASTALLSAVKLLPFPSSVKSPSPSEKRDDTNKNSVLSRSFSRRLLSRSFWKKPSRRELNVDGDNGRKSEDREQEIQRCRSFADFLQESQDQACDRISCVSPTILCSGEATLLSNPACESSSFSSEFFTNSEVTQSSSGESETSNENDAVEEKTETLIVVMMSGDCVGSHVSDGSTINDNREECVNEESEQFSPISILECPFEDDPITPPSHQNDEKKLMSKSRRFESLVRLEPVDLEKRIEQYVEMRQEYESQVVQTEEDQSENRGKRLFALVKARLIDETNNLLATSLKVDNLLLDFFKENWNSEIRDEDKLVKIVEEWVMRRGEEEYMFMSWEVREKREIYVKEMKWDCINEDEREYVVEELENGFVTYLIDELILDLSL